MTRRIAVMTADEDVPGMNAAIRGVARMALEQGWQVMGVCADDDGQVDSKFIDLTARTVEGISQWSGSLLESISSSEIESEGGSRIALRHFASAQIDALIIIGGAHAQASAAALDKTGFPVNTVVASMENDVAGFDTALGVDTGINAALDTIDRLKMSPFTDNATFIVEVVGRVCGYSALTTGILVGADAVIVPEVVVTPDQIALTLRGVYEQAGAHPLIIVAEGVTYNAHRLHNHFAKGEHTGHSAREALIAHVQRRAAPSAFDRMIGIKVGMSAVEALARGEHGRAFGWRRSEVSALPLADVVGKTRALDEDLMRLASLLSLADSGMAQTH